jgi:pyruvate dehydrogenase E1 component alpha subunit
MELTDLYRQMVRARAYELAVKELWDRGLISGEMHLGTGEEAIAAGVVTHLRGGDGLSLTHRCSPALVVRGVPLVAMLREMLGKEDGLCRGRGGHMHLLSRDHLAATSGIVGASLPLGAGFALAGKRLRKGSIGLAFIGDGSMNQGMALEALNLAKAWELPLVVVCIDNGWAIATVSGSVTGGDLVARAEAFGWLTASADGTDVEAVHAAAGDLIDKARKGKGPCFLYTTSPRIDGHFLGDALLHQARNPMGNDAKETIGRVTSSARAKGGAGIVARAGSVARIMAAMAKARGTPEYGDRGDPLRAAQRAMRKRGNDPASIDEQVAREIDAAVQEASHD